MKVIDMRNRLGVIQGGKKKTFKGASSGQVVELGREDILLLRLADKIDALFLDGILEHDMSAPEIAALAAHRLGRLLLAMPSLPGCVDLDTVALREHLHEIIDREATDPEVGLKKSS